MSDRSPVPFSESQVREVLQYVPTFRGQTFVVAFDGGALPDPALAEILLDLLALQNIGVHLVLAYFGKQQDDFLDWSAELELKLSSTTLGQLSSVLSRGQAAFVPLRGEMSFSAELLALSAGAHKVLYVSTPEELPAYFEGALSVEEARDCYQAARGTGSSHYENAIVLVEKGVKRVHLLNGGMAGCLSRELFSNEGVGVMIYDDSYREIRPLSEEDIPELLAIIGRSVRSAFLLPRSYEEIQQHLADYYVMTIDGNVVGCIALHPYVAEQKAEIACLFVKPSHAGLGYGRELVSYAEQEALHQGIRELFALSTSAGGFFERHLGYAPVELGEIPPARYQKLSRSGRNSTALSKELPLPTNERRE